MTKITTRFFVTLALICCWSLSAPAADYTVVDTGQHKCYDNADLLSPFPRAVKPFHGQDAQYHGPLFAFQDNGDGTVTDLNTGLMWQQDPGPMKHPWHGALNQANNLSLAGYTDWRLPTIKELYSIIDYGRGWPYIDTTYFDCELDPQDPKNTQYWSGTEYVGLTHGGQETAFGVNFATGHIKGYGTMMPAYARCVRGSSYGANSFVDNGDGTVTDTATGLMWQQADDGVTRNWEDALAYAESLTTAGYDDWRLPTNKELQSIVDYTHSPNAVDPADLGPAIDTNFFSITPLPPGTTNYDPDYGYFWTNTNAYHSNFEPDYYYGWYVAFGTAVDGIGGDTHGAGAVRFDAKTEGPPLAERIYNYVRCVRGGLIESPTLDVKANGSDSPITVSPMDKVSLTINVDQGDISGQDADWWLLASTSAGHHSYVHATGWLYGIRRAYTAPIFSFSAPYEVFNALIPPGEYTFCFALDGNMDDALDATWYDSVMVHVQ